MGMVLTVIPTIDPPMPTPASIVHAFGVGGAAGGGGSAQLPDDLGKARLHTVLRQKKGGARRSLELIAMLKAANLEVMELPKASSGAKVRKECACRFLSKPSE